MENLPVLDFAETMAGLPKQQPDDGLDEAIRKALADRYDVVIVLDDDPTGTQTVYDVPVVAKPSPTLLHAEIEKGTPLFFVLTNSRSLTQDNAGRLASRIGTMIKSLCVGKRYLVIFRGDSTLRGHYPHEEKWLSIQTNKSTGEHWIIPAFFEGGRYTINDIHYVKEGRQLIPAAQTAFARDPAFGYENSDLKKWVAEKGNKGRKRKMYGASGISLEELRDPDIAKLERRVKSIRTEVLVVNAVDYTDLKRAALVILRNSHVPILRTSASFIKALLGQPDRPLLKLKRRSDHGGLIIVGSHVPKTTAQLAHLRANADLSQYEVDVRALLFEKPVFASCDLAQKISEEMAAGKDVLLYTSREVITTDGAAANLDIAAKVSAYLEEVVAELAVQPSFLLTKGGITSSRIATESLGVKRAMALGQVQPGVPTWELGPESKFPGMPFIIFPGNVGGEDSLSLILQNTIL